ncbi:WXG100 family type VII secretion target [Actinomadura napierensis]|uniref:PPE domain-containing protein n=1 Tax=Actinomadura napierensis TaxID=267854 RepID=A0ABP5LWH7_9ACTN
MTTYKDSPLRTSPPSGSPNSYTSKEQITAYLRNVDPGTVTTSGQGYLDLAKSYDKAMTELRGFAHDLSDAWKGPASSAAQAQLREIFSAAFVISSHSQQIGTAVRTHGDSYLAWYKSNMPTAQTVEEARQWMQGANERASETWSAIPADISTGLPSVTTKRNEFGAPATGSGGGTGAGGTGSGSASASGGGSGAVAGTAEGFTGGHSTSPSSGHASGSQTAPLYSDGPGHVIGQPGNSTNQVHGGPLSPGDGSGTELSGLSPSGMAGGGLTTEGPGSPGIGGGAFGGGLGPGGSASPGLPGGSTGGGLPGSGGGLPGTAGGFVPGPGAIGGALGRGAAGSGGNPIAGRPGAPGTGIPGTTGHGGRDDKERERGAWLPDDPDIWDGDIEAVPGVIGSAPPKPVDPEKPGQAEKTDEAALLRRVLARLAELETQADSAPPPPAAPRMEWTD